MSAFMIFHSAIKDSEQFQAYAQAVPRTLKNFGGTLLTKGKAARVLSGQHQHSNVGILKFDDLKQAHGWYESKDYQALIPIRDAAADMTVISYEEPEK